MESDPGDEIIIELGDYITIDNKKYGPVKGTVYYRSDELIRIMPEGVSDRVYDFWLEDGEFRDDYNVIEVRIHRKHLLDSFVRLNDLRVGQLIETFNEDAQSAGIFKIKAVNEENDAIDIEDSEGAIMNIVFDYTGIPLDTGFTVLRNREEQVAEVPVESTVMEPVEEPAVAENLEEGEGAGAGEGEDAASEEEEFDLNVVGVITLPITIEVQNIPSAEQIYPDSVQKADALNDILNRLTQSQKKDPKYLRQARLFVEMMFALKQELVKYSPEGQPQGYAITSVDTISQLFNATSVPLGRPVLDIIKDIYIEKDEEESLGVPEGGIIDDGLRRKDMTVESNAQLSDPFMKLSGSTSAGAASKVDDKKETSNFWLSLLTYMRKYNQPWVSDENIKDVAQWYAKKDTDFFRREIPDLEDKTIPSLNGEIGIALERALGAIYHPDIKKRQKLTFPAESAPILNYILFPLKEAASFGSTRTGSLGIDIDNNLHVPRWTTQAIEEAGGIDEVATGNSFVVLGVRGNTVGNIPLADYIRALKVGGRNYSDMTAIMAQLGLTEMELSIDVAKLIGEKMENTRKSIEEHIRSLRIKLDELKDTMIAGPEVDEELIDSLEKSITNPQLLEQINALKKGSPLISKSGLVQVAALLKYSPDLFMAVGGEQPTIVAKQSLLARRRQFLTMLASAKALRDYEDMKGAPPIPNTCVHVNLLRDIKRIDDAPTQFIRLSAFIRKFQGHRDSNWIDCRECKKHLICIHELIQMQQYLNPKDSNTLQKELNLNFCGPVQGGNYQCRNCGQAISSIDFDRGIEFDDEGRPMSGGVIIDDAGVQQQDIEILLGTVSSVDEEEKVDDLEGDRDLQLIIKEITNRIGIFADKKGYSRMIKNIKPYMMTITSPEYRARIRAEAEKKGRLPEKDREKIIEDRIEEYYSRKIISYAAAAILIEVQTRTPDYIIRYTLPGCNKPGFTGFPIGSDNDKTGIEYLSCAVGSIMKNQYPWNKTGFLKEGNPMKRQQGIAIYIEGGIKELLTNPTVQYNLSEKKKYLKALYGSEGGDGKQTDIIFPGFLPRLQTISAEEAAEEPVIAEVAKHPDQLADLWIRMGHKMAKKTAFAVKGSPFLDTTCCVSSIKQPGIFWSALSDIPRLENRHTKSKIGGTRFMVPFSPRLKKEDLPEANPNIYHRVFLNVCFRGPRIGQPHEPGLTLRCPWCDFVFPSHPRILDYDNEGKSALDGQDVTINYTTFQEVLDASHKNTAIPKYIIPSKVDINNIMELTTVEPAISATWAEDLTELIKNISALPRGELSEIDIALAAGKFSDAINRAEAYVYDNITSSTSKSDVKSGALKGLQFINTTASGEEIREIIKTYLIIPMQRILSGLDSTNHINTIDVLKSTLNLSDAHISEKLKPMMNKNEAVNNTEHIQLFNKAQYSFARAKLLHFVRQVNAVVNAAQYINSTNVPGGEPIFKYIMKYILYIPLSSLLSEYSLPPEKYEVTSGVNAIGNSMQLLTNTVIVTLHNYKDEHIVFSDKELQERLQIRIEKEAMEFVKEFDNKTEEERAIEKTKKKYGLGKWSVGGTKAIYMYDPDRYDAEREEKIRAGIIDVTQEKAEYDISKYDLFGISAGIEDEGDRLGVDSGFEDNF